MEFRKQYGFGKKVRIRNTAIQLVQFLPEPELTRLKKCWCKNSVAYLYSIIRIRLQHFAHSIPDPT